MELSEIVKKGSKRIHIQRGGPGPLNVVNYYGVDTQYLAFTGATRPLLGGVSPVNIADPFELNRFASVDVTVDPPDLPTGTLQVLEKVGTLPFSWTALKCALNAYILGGACLDPSSFDFGWSGFVEVWGGGLATEMGGGDRTALDSDEMVTDELAFTFRRSYGIGSLLLNARAAATIIREIVDVVVGPNAQCGECGIANDGFKWQYAIHKESSGVAAAQAAYSTDSGVTWTLQAITGIALTETPVAIGIAGEFLIILVSNGASATQSAYYYTTINQLTGIPAATWTKVSAGFAASSQLANDLFVLSPREVFFVADAGYIYKSTDITAGVSVVDAGGATTANLRRIHGKGDTLVAVGATGKVVKSSNRGRTWALTTTDPHANIGSGVLVQGPKFYWVGSDSGDFFYTLDGGESWTSKGLGITAAGVQDIVSPTPEVMYVLATVTGPSARILASINGGRSFVNASVANPRLLNLPPGNQRFNRASFPSTNDLTIASNRLLVGGLATGTDGVIITAEANEV